jgi:uncharacterized protein (TIGR00251 family)
MTTNISVKVQTNASRNEVIGQAEGVWKIKIAAPADKGKANKEIVHYFSELLNIKKVQINILRGITSHNKVLAIEGLNPQEVIERLNWKDKTGS